MKKMKNDPTVEEVFNNMSKRKKQAFFRIADGIADKKPIKASDILVFEKDMDDQEKKVFGFLISKLIDRIGGQDEQTQSYHESNCRSGCL